MGEYTHFDAEGRPTLVDVSDKAVTKRTAWAEGWLFLPDEIYRTVSQGAVKREIPSRSRSLAASWGPKGLPTSSRSATRSGLTTSRSNATWIIKKGPEDHLRGDGLRGDGRGDGGAHRRLSRGAHLLRHVQGDRQGHGDKGHPPAEKDRRQERRMERRREFCLGVRFRGRRV